MKTIQRVVPMQAEAPAVRAQRARRNAYIKRDSAVRLILTIVPAEKLATKRVRVVSTVVRYGIVAVMNNATRFQMVSTNAVWT